jgi:hypothetical protein
MPESSALKLDPFGDSWSPHENTWIDIADVRLLLLVDDDLAALLPGMSDTATK